MAPHMQPPELPEAPQVPHQLGKDSNVDWSYRGVLQTTQFWEDYGIF